MLYLLFTHSCCQAFRKTFEVGFSRLSTTEKAEIGAILDEPIPVLAGFNYFKENHLFQESLLTELAIPFLVKYSGEIVMSNTDNRYLRLIVKMLTLTLIFSTN